MNGAGVGIGKDPMRLCWADATKPTPMSRMNSDRMMLPRGFYVAPGASRRIRDICRCGRRGLVSSRKRADVYDQVWTCLSEYVNLSDSSNGDVRCLNHDRNLRRRVNRNIRKAKWV
jgi:hypothetical protein